MKRWLSVLVLSWVLIGLAGAMPVAAADPYPFVIDHVDSYILIKDAADLTAFAAGINDGTLAAATNARLTDNIVLRDTDDWAEWETNAPVTTVIPEWTPIGNTTNSYKGTFDGAGHTVSGIYINDSLKDFQGLFGFCYNATIQDLAVTKSYINGRQYTAGVVGAMSGSITNCSNSGTVKGIATVGGVAGNAQTMTNCHNSGIISGDFYTGGVAGYSSLNITNCTNSGSVSGREGTGGVAGKVDHWGDISNCSNTGSISGTTMIGGVGGDNSGKIINCYNSGKVSGTATTGGVAGSNFGDIDHCYYAADSVPSGCYGIGNSASDDLASTAPKTAAEFASGEVAYLLNTFTGFDTSKWFNWTQNPGDAAPSFTSEAAKAINKKITFDYPAGGDDTYGYGYLGGTIVALPIPPSGTLYTYTNGITIRSQAEMEAYVITGEVTFTVDQYALTCNNAGIIEIGTKAELTEFATYVNAGNTNANAVLTDNIVLRDTDDWGDWSDATAPDDIAGNPAWIPIGNTVKPYSGTFDGGGFTVSGIYINNSSKDFQGLFGNCFKPTIKNLAVTKSYINGGQCTAGVVGFMAGSITNCTNSGTVRGTAKVGGVAGCAETMSNCHNSGSISGNYDTGGVAGYGAGDITNCSNSGSVSGGEKTGGVTGEMNNGTITNCYNTGSVSGGEKTGGVTGEMNSAIITNCYNTGSVSGTNSMGGVVGKNTSGLSNCYYAEGSVPFGCYGIGNALSDNLNKTAPKTAAEFASGEVAWRLQNNQAELIWGQNLSGAAAETLPLLKSADPVRQVSFFKADGTTLYKNVYVNQYSKVTPADLVGYNWQDASLAAFTAETSITTDLTLTPTVAVLPTATAIYGSKLGSIAFSGGSVPLSGWSWSGTAAELAQIPVLGNTVAYQASYTATEDILGTMTFAITPTIKSPGGGGGGGGTPAMSGITVAPGASTFDPTGQLTVAITGAPAGAVVYYSLDGSSYSTTLPAITAAGEITVFIKISCPGYQDYTTQTTVTVAKHQAPEIPVVSLPITEDQSTGATELSALLPADRGQTQYRLGTIADPGGLLNEPPTIDQNGLIAYGFRSHLSNSEEAIGATAATENAADASATITVLVAMENYADTTITLVLAAVEPIGVRYVTHIQDYGWETDWVTAGALSGTVGEAKRLEALKIELTGAVPADAVIETAVHVQNKGDLGPFAMGSAVGTSGEGLRLERITLNLTNLPGYTLYYNVHVQNKGWLCDEDDVTTWFTSGETAGTIGESLRLESIRIKLVKNSL